LAGMAEFGRAAVGGGNLAETLHTLGRCAAQALQVRFAAVYRVREDGGVRLEIAQGPPAARETQARVFSAAAGEVGRPQRRLAGRMPGPPPGADGDGTGPAVWAFEPIVAYGTVLGVLAAWDDAERPASVPDWERGDLETLAALADHAALLCEH